ncbi:hypothetical protein R6Z07F_004401 [Ovis aries]
MPSAAVFGPWTTETSALHSQFRARERGAHGKWFQARDNLGTLMHTHLSLGKQMNPILLEHLSKRSRFTAASVKALWEMEEGRGKLTP